MAGCSGSCSTSGANAATNFGVRIGFGPGEAGVRIVPGVLNSGGWDGFVFGCIVTLEFGGSEKCGRPEILGHVRALPAGDLAVDHGLDPVDGHPVLVQAGPDHPQIGLHRVEDSARLLIQIVQHLPDRVRRRRYRRRFGRSSVPARVDVRMVFPVQGIVLLVNPLPAADRRTAARLFLGRLPSFRRGRVGCPLGFLLEADPLVDQKRCNLDQLSAIHLVAPDEIVLGQRRQHVLRVHLVVGQYLGLEPRRPVLQAALAVGRQPEPDEEKARPSRVTIALRQLLVHEELRPDGPDPHATLQKRYLPSPSMARRLEYCQPTRFP